MVVLVLIINCQVSLNPKKGPAAAQTRMIATAITKVTGRPTVREVHFAIYLKSDLDLAGRLIIGKRYH